MGDGVTSDNLPTVSQGPRTEVRRPDFGAWRYASSGCRPASGPHSLAVFGRAVTYGAPAVERHVAPLTGVRPFARPR